MHLAHRRQSTMEPELNMPAMVDIVFLLLIFFMCTSAVSTMEQKLVSRMAKPASGQASAPDPIRPIRIQVRAGAVGKQVQILLNHRPCPSYDSLIEQLTRRRRVMDVQVIIEGHREVLFQHMVSVLDACYQAGMTRVAFSPKDSG